MKIKCLPLDKFLKSFNPTSVDVSEDGELKFECCENCKFSFGFIGKERIYCRRYPPDTIKGDDFNSWSEYPMTEKENWCGEYKHEKVKI